jgi:hypothetical protein
LSDKVNTRPRHSLRACVLFLDPDINRKLLSAAF